MSYNSNCKPHTYRFDSSYEMKFFLISRNVRAFDVVKLCLVKRCGRDSNVG